MVESVQFAQAPAPALTVYLEDPPNAGTPRESLIRDFLTPTPLFYLRSHAPTPAVDAASYVLRVAGEVGTPLALSLPELLARFPRVEIAATLQCAGHRRLELHRLSPIPDELLWGPDAISTALWSGVRLRDVLLAAGLRAGTARHVAFEGLDEIRKGGAAFGYGGSIPVEKALGPEVLLADRMNGEPLPPVHGFPLRMVVPGYIGARSVKWLHAIRVQAEPSDNYYQAHAYKLFPPETRAETVDWSQGQMLGPLPLDAVILSPGEGEVVPAGDVPVHGYAIVGDGRGLDRVELSADGGRSWPVTAALGTGQAWTWRRWTALFPLAPGERRLLARAWDTTGQTQPSGAEATWNFKGYANNARHVVEVRVR